MTKIIRVTTVPQSLGGLLQGQLQYMSRHYDVIGISSTGDGRLSEVGITEGIPVIAVEMTRKITPFADLKAVYKLYKIFKREKPTIVHSHTPKAGTLAMLAAKLSGVPHRLHTIAGLPLLVATGGKRKLLDTVEKFTYACATKIYPNSYGLKSIIVKNGYTTETKLKVIGKGSSNGIDTSFFNPELYSNEQHVALRKELNISQSDYVFVFVGRLVKDKGINELIEAYQTISNDYKNTKLLLVGTYEKDLDPLLPKTEKEINTNPNIISVGWQTDVRPFFHASDALVFPSYREGFPNVVMQAGAMGLPSIVTDINGCNEIVEQDTNGIIIQPQDVHSLLEAMKKFLENPDLAKKLSKNAREAITSRYERLFVWKKLHEEYEQLLKK